VPYVILIATRDRDHPAQKAASRYLACSGIGAADGSSGNTSMSNAKIGILPQQHHNDRRPRFEIDMRTIAVDVLIVVSFLLLIVLGGLVLTWVMSFAEGVK
jgi:hypothetical protein